MKFKPIVLIVVIVCVFLAAPFCLQAVGFLAWSEINCIHYSIDIKSGKQRIQKYYWFVEYSDSLQSTPMSRALGTFSRTEADWHKYVTLSFMARHSPHYIYHSAGFQISMAARALAMAESDPEDARILYRRISESWIETGSDHRASDIIDLFIDDNL